MLRCVTWENIAQLRAELHKVIEARKSYSHPDVVGISVDLDAQLNRCQRCPRFPCELVPCREESRMWKAR